MTSGILCIGPADPAFIAALTAGVLVAAGLAPVLGRFERPIRGRLLSQGYRNVIWFGMLATVFVVQMVLLNWFFGWEHPGLTLCTSLIWRWLFVPPILLFVAGVALGIRERRKT